MRIHESFFCLGIALRELSVGKRGTLCACEADSKAREKISGHEEILKSPELEVVTRYMNADRSTCVSGEIRILGKCELFGFGFVLHTISMLGQG